MILNKLIIGIISFFIFSTAQASTVVLSVGLMNQDRFPYFMLPKHSSPPTGMYIDLLEAIGKQAGIQFTYRFLPQTRIRHLMKYQKLDIEPGIAKEWRTEPKEKENSVYSVPFLHSEEVIVYNPLFFKDPPILANFSDKTPCSIDGFNDITLSDDHEEIDRNVGSEEQSFKMLHLHRCDYALFPKLIAEYHSEQYQLQQTETIRTFELRLRLSKKNAFLLPQINQSIHYLQSHKKIEAILLHYTKGHYRE